MDAADVASVLEKNQFAVAARTVVETSSAKPVAVQLSPVRSDAPARAATPPQLPSLMDAPTVTAIVSALRLELGPPTSPLLFAMNMAQLALLPQARTPGEQALIVDIDAEQVMTQPGRALNFIRIARSRNWEIGLNGVGASIDSLRAAVIVEPALITLDATLLIQPGTRLAAETKQTVQALVKSTGAVVMSQNTSDDRLQAVATRLGATLRVQEPTAASWSSATPNHTLNLFTAPASPSPRASIYAAASSCYRPRQSPKSELLSLSRHIETLACGAGPSTLVFACLQQARNLTPDTHNAYEQLVSSNKLVIMAAKGLRQPIPGTLNINLDRHDPLAKEWVLTVLGPTISVLLTATNHHPPSPELPLDNPDGDRFRVESGYDYVLTHDRDLTAYAVRCALLRI